MKALHEIEFVGGLSVLPCYVSTFSKFLCVARWYTYSRVPPKNIDIIIIKNVGSNVNNSIAGCPSGILYNERTARRLFVPWAAMAGKILLLR
jgi:hypothetical protein